MANITIGRKFSLIKVSFRQNFLNEEITITRTIIWIHRYLLNNHTVEFKDYKLFIIKLQRYIKGFSYLTKHDY